MPHADPILRAEWQKAYRERNKDRIRAAQKVYRDSDPERAAKKRADYLANTDAYKARARKWKEKNAEKIKAQRSTPEYREARNAARREAYVPKPKKPLLTDEEKRQRKQNDYLRHRDQRKERMRAHYQTNKHQWKGQWQKKPYWIQKFEHGLKKAVRKGGEIIDRDAIRAYYRDVYTNTAAVCDYCRGLFPIRQIIVEHKQPYAIGGCHAVSNFALSCNPCNLRKGTKPYDLWVSQITVNKES